MLRETYAFPGKTASTGSCRDHPRPIQPHRPCLQTSGSSSSFTGAFSRITSHFGYSAGDLDGCHGTATKGWIIHEWGSGAYIAFLESMPDSTATGTEEPGSVISSVRVIYPVGAAGFDATYWRSDLGRMVRSSLVRERGRAYMG